MRKIFPLPKEVIAKIAAGEVIERPVYAVKELIENSLDAGADTIAVYIEEAGLRKITVIDNGKGMSREDLQECFKLHTTSKLSDEEQLSHIESLGFRGEALSSIAAISTLSIKSRTDRQANGTSVEVVDGKPKKIAPVGMPVGTAVTVSRLFHSVPGRKKFLKSARTEFRHIVDLLTHVALSYPEIHFSFYHNKKPVFDLHKTTPLERIKLLLGSRIFSHLLPVSHKESFVAISGFLTTPQATTSLAHKQFIFVNQRKVTDKLIAQAVKDAYGTLIESKAYPVFVLFVSLPYELVDVNVHPRKEEIRFIDSTMMYDAVYKAVSEVLAKNNLTFYSDTAVGIGVSDGLRSTKMFAGRVLKENQIPWDIRTRKDVTESASVVQFHNLYLITQTKYGIALIDQHAAHERILYEQFLAEFKKQKRTQGQYHFSKPVILDLSLSGGELLQEHLTLFEQLGFEIEPFKDSTFLLHAVPLLFQDRKPEEFIAELLEDLHQEKRSKEVDKVSSKMIAYLACRAAVKAGESLTKKQCRELLEKLEKTTNNATCPHGRPTKVIIDIERVHTLFKRK